MSASRSYVILLKIHLLLDTKLGNIFGVILCVYPARLSLAVLVKSVFA